MIPGLLITITHAIIQDRANASWFFADMWNQLNRLRFPKITFKWGSPPLPFEFSLNGHCCQLVPLAHELHAWHNPPALISSSCGNFQKHVLVSHNESFSDCHGWIVWGNDNFDANLLIIHWCNRRLRILGKTGPFYEQNWLYTYVCNQWSLVMALRIIWLQLSQLVHKNGISSHRLVHHQLWMTLLHAYFDWVR